MASDSDAAKSSQDIIDSFWKANIGSTQPPTRPFSVLPDNVYAKLERQRSPKGVTQGVSVAASYAEAVKDCEAKVAKIVAECKRNNIKYSDSHFNLDWQDDCLEPLTAGKAAEPPEDGDVDSDASSVIIPRVVATRPACAKRVGAIFEKPEFFIGGPPNIRDIRQGSEGDCWMLSSLDSLCVDEEDGHLVERLCPPKARNEKVGVYGFVFYRDGEWFSEIIDDKLYLDCPDYDDCKDYRRDAWDDSHSKLDPAAKRDGFRKAFQTGSDALFYGSCSDPNETWVPLIEKAFAKAHGDYTAIASGAPGEGLEDLTGGITSLIVTADILDIDELWTEGLLHVNKMFLFGAATRNWLSGEAWGESGRQGIQDGHAYSVLRAVEYKGHRLIQMKNPWGRSEWSGAWSDGSKEWTAEAMKDLEVEFGNDGIFWIPYEDFLRRFSGIWRTRIFSADWKVTQQWTTVQVPWSGDYNPTKFEFTIPEATRAVVVLSQLDDRYFRGLAGQYGFELSFRLHASGDETHLIRGYSSGNRSAVAELDLEAGKYEVLMHISAWRDKTRPKIEDVVKTNWLRRRTKLLQIGLSYDLAQAKGQIEPSTILEDKEKAKPATEEQLTPPTPPSEPSAAPEEEEAPAQESQNVGAEAGDDPQPDQTQPEPPQPILHDEDGDESPGPGAWNATMVVGLRVFCQSSSAEIKVVSPQTESAIQAAKEEVKLDIDDPEKDHAEQHESGKGDENDIDDSQ